MEVEEVEAKVTELMETEEESRESRDEDIFEMDFSNQEGDSERVVCLMDENSQYNRLENEDLEMYDAPSSQQGYHHAQDSEMDRIIQKLHLEPEYRDPTVESSKSQDSENIHLVPFVNACLDGPYPDDVPDGVIEFPDGLPDANIAYPANSNFNFDEPRPTQAISLRSGSNKRKRESGGVGDYERVLTKRWCESTADDV